MKYPPVYLADLMEAADNIPDVTRVYGKTVLVTGASGLIGATVVDMLLLLDSERAADIRVIAAGRSPDELAARFSRCPASQRLKFLQYSAGEGLDGEENTDFIVHCAGIANTQLYAEQPVETLLTTVLGTKDSLEYARHHPGCRVLFVSSGEIYGRREERTPFREDECGTVDILNPRACYPSGRRAAETLCAAYRREFGVDVVVARPGHVYGPFAKVGDARASSQFPRNALSLGRIVLKSPGAQVRSYCYAADVASALLSILSVGKSGEAYNVAIPASEVSIRQMAEAFADAFGAEIELGKASESEKSGYNLMDYSVLNADKLSALGWKAAFPMERGARHTRECLKAIVNISSHAQI